MAEQMAAPENYNLITTPNLKHMKTKYILAILFTAIVTLSFTFISTKSNNKPVESQPIEDNSAPIGGLAADDSL
jgi:hypothetical protein